MKKMISKNTVICFIVMAMTLLLLPYNKINVKGEEEWRISGKQENPVPIDTTAELSVTVSKHDYSGNDIDITNACTFQWCEYTGGDINDTTKLANESNRNELNGEVGSTFTVNNITTLKQYICLVTYNGETRLKGFNVYPDNGLSVEAVENDLKVEYGKDAKIAAYVYAADFTNMKYELQKQQIGSSGVCETVNGVDPTIENVTATCRKITYTVKSTMNNKGTYRIIATDCYGTTKRCDVSLRFALKVNYSPDVSVQSGKDVTLTVKPSIDETIDKDFSFLYSWSYDGENAFSVTNAGSLTLKNVTKNEKIYCNIIAHDAQNNNSGYVSAIFNIKVVQPATESTTPVSSTSVIGTTITVSGITFKVKATSTVELTKAPTTKSVTIPDTVVVNGKKLKVTSIGANAFKNNTKITKVVIGKNVTKIGKNAFYKCTKLNTVKMGKNVTEIGANAFNGCGSLTSVTLSDKTTKIGANAFYKCTKLKTVKIGKNVTGIGANAFKGCSALTSLTIPSKTTKIGANAFNGCKKLKTIKITSTKLTSKTVEKNAFKGLTRATTIKVPKKKLTAYKKLFKSKGLSSKVTVKGY